jgi:hypothetical protein
VKHAKEPEPRPGRPFKALAFGVLAIGVVAVGFLVVDPHRGDDGADALGAGQAQPTPSVSTTTTPEPDPIDAYRGTDWVARENAKAGTTDWHIPDDRSMWDRISGYADATSIDFGGTFTLRVSTGAPTFVVSAYRIGYYGGTGGRLVWRSDPVPAVRQPGPVADDASTGTFSAPWEPSLTVTTDADWPPGQYLLRLESSDGGATFVPLVIRDDGSHSDLLLQSAVTTWQAYNGWGGASLYQGNEGRADVVSFDRPYTGNGSGEFLGREYEFIYLVERLGLDVSYWTDIDLHERGDLARNHRAVVIPGHDEYYTVEMRQALEAARDAGVNLGFFGANNIYRRIRLEPSALGSARHEVNYRDATRDPLADKDPTRVTTRFREAPAADPESSLIGNYYECNPVEADWVVADPTMWMFEGSGFTKGERVPDMVGNEYDRVTPGVPTPENIQILAHSPVTCKGNASYADSTWYSAPSGAGVFAAGTFGWSPLMDDPCPDGPVSVRCKLVRVTENILRAFAAGPAGAAHPSVSNLAALGIPRPRPATTSTTSSTTATTPGAP